MPCGCVHPQRDGDVQRQGTALAGCGEMQGLQNAPRGGPRDRSIDCHGRVLSACKLALDTQSVRLLPMLMCDIVLLMIMFIYHVL